MWFPSAPHPTPPSDVSMPQQLPPMYQRRKKVGIGKAQAWRAKERTGQAKGQATRALCRRAWRGQGWVQAIAEPSVNAAPKCVNAAPKFAHTALKCERGTWTRQTTTIRKIVLRETMKFDKKG